MEEKSNDYEIPTLESKLFYGLSVDIKGNVIFVNDNELLHPAGKILVFDNLKNGSQHFIKVQQSRKEISEITVSPNRKFVVVGEKGEKPTLSIFDLSTRKRLKLLGIPLKDSTAIDWASIAFMTDNVHLIAVTGEPNWNYLIYDWFKGRVVSWGEASYSSLAITQVVPNPEDSSMFALIGPGLFRLMIQSDKIWRQYGFSKAEKVPLLVSSWLGPGLILAGSTDGRLLLVEYGELRGLYQADHISEIDITESKEIVTLASNTVSKDNLRGINEVRAMASFGKGFLYSCRPGEIVVFSKVTESRWVKKNIIRISSVILRSEEYNRDYKICNVTVNPSQNKIVCTTKKTEMYISEIFFEQDFEKEPVTELRLLGDGYHDGAIASVSTCLWKPIILTAGLNDKTIRLWNYETMKVIMLKKCADVIYSASLHPSGFYCLLGFTDKLYFNLILVNDIKAVGHVDIRACKMVSFSTGGHLFAAAKDAVIEVYSAVFFTRLHTLTGHMGPINRLMFSRNDKTLWSCGGEGSLYEWDMESGKRVSDIFTNKNGQSGLSVGENVYTVGTDGTLKEVVDSVIYKEIEMLQGSLSSASVGNSGQLLLLGGHKGSVVSMRYPLVHPPKWHEFSMHSRPIAHVIITRDDKTVMSTSVDGFICIWNVVYSEEKRSGIVETLPDLSETLVSLQELEETSGLKKELSERLLEIRGQHEYTIGQMSATNETSLKETISSYNTMLQDIKFKLQQKEREHLLEINNLQTNRKEIYGQHQKEIEDREQHFSKKLLEELKKIAKLEEINENLKIEFERRKEEMEKEGFENMKGIVEEKDSVIRKTQLHIEELQENLNKVNREKEEMKNLLEKRFAEERKKIEELCELQIEKANQSLIDMTTEAGIMGKQVIIVKEEIKKLNVEMTRLNNKIISKEKKFEELLEDIEMSKKEMKVKENVIRDKDNLIIRITKENDSFYKEIRLRNETVAALICKVEPLEKELKSKEQLLEKKDAEINEFLRSLTSKDKDMEAFKKKLKVFRNTIKKQNLTQTKIKLHLRKMRFDLQIAASYAFRPLTLKNKILEISQKYLESHKEELQLDEDAYKESVRQTEKLETVISKLQKRLSLQKPIVKHVYKPPKPVLDLIAELNRMTFNFLEQKKKVEYLESLLKLNIKQR